MKKWAKGKSEALPLTPAILHNLHTHSDSSGPTSAAACIFDAICIGLQTGSRCGEYCRGNPTEPDAPFSRVPLSHYAAEFAGYPLAFVPDDVSFLDASLHFIPPELAISKAEFVRIRFKFDKGGTGNLSCRTFKRFPPEKSTFCPLLAATRALARWRSHNLSPLTPLFCYTQNGSACFLQDTTVTKHLRDAAILAYPNPSHIYRRRLADVRTHSLRVSACLILVTAGLPTPAIEYRLRWASDAWKVYVRESLTHIDQAQASSFYTPSQDDTTESPSTSHQAFDADDFL